MIPITVNIPLNAIVKGLFNGSVSYARIVNVPSDFGEYPENLMTK